METATDQFDLKDLDKSDWKTYRFDEIAQSISERVDPNDTDLDIYVGLEHIDPEDIHIRRNGTSDDVKGTKLRFYPGDIIFGRRRAYLRKAAIAKMDGFCSAHALVLRANPEIIDPDLFPFFMHSDQFMHRAVDISVGSLSPTINWGTLKTQEFKLPPKDQQAQLAELLWAMDEIIEKTNEVLKKNQILFETTLKEVYSGVNGEVKDLKDVSNIIMGQSPPGSSYNENGSGEPFIQGNAEFGKKYPKQTKFTTSPKKFAPKGSILMSVRAPVGDLNFADKKYCIGRGLAAIEVPSQDLLHYVFNFLKFSKVNLERKSTGSTFKSINKKILKSLSIKIPSDEIIKKNVAIFNRIEQNLEKINQELQASKKLSNSIINQAF